MWHGEVRIQIACFHSTRRHRICEKVYCELFFQGPFELFDPDDENTFIFGKINQKHHALNFTGTG